MIVLNKSCKKNIEDKTYIALGSFDGLHIGHLELINKTIKLAKDNRAKSAVFTFDNHPLSIINKDMVPKLLLDNTLKEELLKKLQLDYLVYKEFDEELMKMTPEEFIYYLIKNYNPNGFIVGFNYRFGFKNLGDNNLLQNICDSEKIDLYIINPVKCNEEIVSSSKIRSLIKEGNLKKANTFLSRPYTLIGHVISGNQVGRTINFPTINLDYNKKFLVPRGGVYLTIVEYNKIKYKGITNIGYNPTIKGNKFSIETHILDFDKTIYGEKVRISFIQRIRDEKKFNSLKELSFQIKNDKEFALSKKIENL
ncbi:bifunctional riboflavin kinase/FAD synthetase [Clostridium sp. DL1XJH146]